MTPRSVLFAMPYNPLVSPGGLQNRSLRTAEAVEKQGWTAAVAAPGPSGRLHGVRVLGFRRPFELARLVVRDGWNILHWLEVFPEVGRALGQHAVSAYVRRRFRTVTVLGTATPGNLRSRGLPRLLKHIATCTYDGAITFNREFEAEYIECGVSPARISFLSQHVDCDRFTLPPPGVRERVRAELSVPDDAFLVAYVGRLVHRKRVDLIIQALEQLAADMRPWAFVIVGESRQHEDSADAQIHALLDGLGQRLPVRRVGYVEDPRSYYWAADVVVVPSDIDGEASVVAEGAACGRVVIVSDSPSLRKFVPANGGSLVFRRGECQSLIEALLHARNLKSQYDDVAASYREIILRRNNLGDLGPRLIGLYQKIAAARPVST